MRKPVLLAPDNFTPATRTPWGGSRIARSYKPGVVRNGHAPTQQIGESWEVSVEPDFPARVDGSGDTLAEVIARDPAFWLGVEHERGRSSTAILVKLLDAADELSVQIHPRDDYAALATDEAGKPESWYVLERDPGAVLYLGLREGVTREQMAAAIEDGDDVSQLLDRVEVEPGDFFRIDAGTPHAIGRGLTLVEPQHVLPGKRGVTYRYWDWNRRYDASGRLDPKGTPRALHVEHALAVTAWDAPRGEAFLDRIRLRAGAVDLEATARADALCGPKGGLPSDHLWIERWSGTGELPPPPRDVAKGTVPFETSVAKGTVPFETSGLARDRLVGLVVVAGEARLAWPGGSLVVSRGRAAAIPARLPQLSVELAQAHALACSVA